MGQPRPFEELYDIKTDPHETQNLADNSSLKGVKSRLAGELKKWILQTSDSGFLTEPDMHRRATAAGVSQHDILRSDASYPIEQILAAADQASRPNTQLLPGGGDPALDFWAIQQRIIRKDDSAQSRQFLKSKLSSDNPTVRATAAEALARLGHNELAVPVYRELLSLKEPNLRLYVARSLALSFDSVAALETEVRATRQEMLAPPGSPRPWKDFLYSAFTAWALEWALVKSGLNDWSDFQGP